MVKVVGGGVRMVGEGSERVGRGGWGVVALSVVLLQRQ